MEVLVAVVPTEHDLLTNCNVQGHLYMVHMLTAALLHEITSCRIFAAFSVKHGPSWVNFTHMHQRNEAGSVTQADCQV